MIAAAFLALQLVTNRTADVPAVHLLPQGRPAGETPYRDLASALAVARAGDVLELDPGRWAGPGNRGLVVTESVTIRGRAGAAETVIDCEGLDHAFELRAPNVSLRELTVRNGSADLGGGIALLEGTALLERVVVERCVGMQGGGVHAGGDLHAVECLLRENQALSGGGLVAYGNVLLERCRLEGNRAAQPGGGMAFSSETGMAMLESCRLRGNESGGDGGGFALLFLGSAVLDRCELLENRSGSVGGGVYSTTLFGTLRLTGCLFAHNRAERVAGAIYATRAAGILGCTIVANTCGDEGAGGVLAGAGLFYGSGMIDAIVRGNRSAASSAVLQQMQTTNGLLPNENFTVLWCNVEGVGDSPTNFDLDPLFVDGEAGDFHLRPSSPCVDAGLTTSLHQGQLDIDGEPRVLGAAVDVGFDEVPRWRAPVARTDSEAAPGR